MSGEFGQTGLRRLTTDRAMAEEVLIGVW